MRRAMRRAARPTVAIARRRSAHVRSRVALGLELRGALRHERVLLGDERVPGAAADRDDDLTALAERVRHGAGVRDGHRRRAVAVANAEQQRVALVADRALDDLA